MFTIPHISYTRCRLSLMKSTEFVLSAEALQPESQDNMTMGSWLYRRSCHGLLTITAPLLRSPLKSIKVLPSSCLYIRLQYLPSFVLFDVNKSSEYFHNFSRNLLTKSEGLLGIARPTDKEKSAHSLSNEENFI